jgi:hypothetical protein
LRKPIRTGRAEIDVDGAAHTNSSGVALFLRFTKTALDTNKQKLTYIKLIKRVNIGKGRDLFGEIKGLLLEMRLRFGHLMRLTVMMVLVGGFGRWRRSNSRWRPRGSRPTIKACTP